MPRRPTRLKRRNRVSGLMGFLGGKAAARSRSPVGMRERKATATARAEQEQKRNTGVLRLRRAWRDFAQDDGLFVRRRDLLGRVVRQRFFAEELRGVAIGEDEDEGEHAECA